jgi:hypothetical protein
MNKFYNYELKEIAHHKLYYQDGRTGQLILFLIRGATITNTDFPPAY